MARIIQPPAPLIISPEEKVLFLAATDESAEAEKWRQAMIGRLEAIDVVILRPTQAGAHAEWQRAGMELADVIAVHFTQAPSDLRAYIDKAVLCCAGASAVEAEEMHRSHAVPVVTSMDELVAYLWPLLV